MSGVERLPFQDHDADHRASERDRSSPDPVASLLRRIWRRVEQSTDEDPILTATTSTDTPVLHASHAQSEPMSSRPSSAIQSRSLEETPRETDITTSADDQASQPDFGVSVGWPSDEIYYRKHGIYMAYASKIPVPEDAVVFYEMEIKKNLLPELEDAFEEVERTACGSGSTIDWVSERVSLQMVGKHEDRRDHIRLCPRICVRCPKRQKRHMEKVLQDYSLNWISRSVFGPILLLPAAELAGSHQPPFIWEIGKDPVPLSIRASTVGNGGLFIQGAEQSFVVQHHIGMPEGTTSPYGAFCRATITHDGHVLAQRYSRIGGIVSNRSEYLAMTTAHHLLDGFWHQVPSYDHVDEVSSINDNNETTAASHKGSDKNVIQTEDENSSDDEYESQYRGEQLTPWHRSRAVPVRTTNPAEITNWTQIHLFLGTSFSSTAMVSVSETWSVLFRMDRENVFSDFALFRFPPGLGAALTGIHSVPTPMSSAALGGTTKYSMQVNILLGVDGVIKGLLLPGQHQLMVRGQQVATRVIELEQAILPPGSSGSWVMGAQELRGMIVAGSQIEPLAYMITADQLLGDIYAAAYFADTYQPDLAFLKPADLPGLVWERQMQMPTGNFREELERPSFGMDAGGQSLPGPIHLKKSGVEDHSVQPQSDAGRPERVHEDLFPRWTGI